MTLRFGHAPAALAAALLCSCGAPALYRPYSEGGSIGYSEVNIAKNRVEVVYHGPSDMDDATAKRFAIFRAAEIGHQNGFAYLRLASSRIRRETSRDALEPDLFPQNPWTGESLTRAEREQRAWEESRRRRQRMSATVKQSPVVQLTVQYRDEDCDDCLSVTSKVHEAIDLGILKP
jgi:hypothetical protein